MHRADTAKPDIVPLPVAIQRYFEVSLYLLVLTGFGTLASTGGLDLPTVVLVGMALLFRGYLLATRREFNIPERWTNYLTLGYVAFYLVDYFLLSGSFLTSAIHLVLFGMVVRLFSAQRERDHYLLAVLSFVMVLAAAVLTVDSIFLFSLAAFMVVAVVTFVLMEMRHASWRASITAKESGDLRAYRRMALSLAGASPLLVALIMAGAFVIFFILPRVSSRYLSAYAPTNDLSVGFSERVQLGQIGQIQQSSYVVMHIKIDGDASGGYDLKWRGVALGLFDGRNWSNPLEQALAVRLPDGRYSVLPARARRQIESDEPTPAAMRSIHYRVVMEPVGTNVFFLAPKPATLEGDYRLVAVDRAGAVYDLDLGHPVGRYEANSNIASPTVEELRNASGSPPASVLLNYLQLPALDARIPQLAEQITGSATSDYEKASALERYLMLKYGYTLELPRVRPADPLANFLFQRKQGHCEYFASAMAVMLRTLHIPSRVVNGFRTGEFNDLTSQYVVRASNAHSWVEAYFPGYGWVSFDPTPPGPPQAHGGWNRVMLYADAMASFWREWVIDYDVAHQNTLAQETARGSRRLLESLRERARQQYAAMLNAASRAQRRVMQSPTRWSVAGVLFMVMLALLVNLRRLTTLIRSRGLRKHPERSPRFAASIWYEQMTRSLARRGLRKLPTQTPVEFVRRIEDGKLREKVSLFTRHYESARSGGSAADACQLPDLYEEITERHG